MIALALAAVLIWPVLCALAAIYRARADNRWRAFDDARDWEVEPHKEPRI